MKNLFAALLIVILFSCSEEKIQPQIAKTKIEGEIPAHESWNSKVMFTDEGRIKAILFSDHLRKFELQKVTLLEGVKIDFYDKKEQRSTSNLVSVTGKVDDILRDMYATGNVIARNDSGVVLKTEELKWRNVDQKIVTDKFVSITTKKEIIEGYGLEADQSLNNYVVFHPTYTASVAKEEKK
ncbi:MAG: LPS export ABC transporter periplasmic protein LptC [Ignavibacteriales bacterium]|nr:LPS export ABC transporter periplasmic protein LptC [Ignavibacteriales bacterium]